MSETIAVPQSAMSGSMGWSSGTAIQAGALQPGTRFGRRYHIIRSLGAGGMGAVYQAWDEELAVVVAIKVIRPEAMADPAAARDLERRFKRELLLARNVTHKNVVRIHDLGEVEGIKYITMPYVHGGDLATLIRREGKLSLSRALRVARQVVAGLVAAHEAGIVHRDLKPANILLDEEDRALITDFGIARSVTGPGAGTMAGMVVGTLEYMAPEQARGVAVDQRADIYAFGLILSDMLIGLRASARGETGLAELFERMIKAPPLLRSIDPDIPEPLERLVARCLDPDPVRRYQTTHELAVDLESIAGDGRATTAGLAAITGTRLPPPPATFVTETAPAAPAAVPAASHATRRWVAVGALMIVALTGVGVFVFRDRLRAPAPSNGVVADRSVALLIVPFRNASGDPSLDSLGSTVADLLRTEVGQSAKLRTVPPDRVSQIVADLKIAPDDVLSPDRLDKMAQFSSADTVLWGQYVTFGNSIRIDATLQDLELFRKVPLKAEAPSEAALPGAIERLAADVRTALALPPEAVKQLAASAFKPSSNSVRALRYYSEGTALSRQGKQLDAVKKFEASTEEDPNFALAFAKLAEAHAALGQTTDAERFSGKAGTLSDALPAQEKYLILATRARILNDSQKAIEYYQTLDKIMPGSDEVQFALATLYKDSGAYDKARQGFKQLLSRDPKYIEALLGAGQVESWSGNGNGAIEYLNHALSIAIQRGNDESKASVLRTLGATYGAMNKPDDGLRYCKESLEIEQKLKRTSGIADSLHTMAQLQDDSGQSDEALKNYREALHLRETIGDKQGVGNVHNDLGSFFAARNRYDEALKEFKDALQVQREVKNAVYEAAALNNIGTIDLWIGNYDDAQTYLQQAVAIRERMNLPSDTADTLHSLAEVSVKTGEYETALNQYLKALDLWRKVENSHGEAIERYELGNVFEYEARYKAAVDSKAQALKIFRDIGDRGAWLPKVLAAYGSALAQIGRNADAHKMLDEALPLARNLHNDELVARILNSQGDAAYYQGDLAGAKRLYEQALAIAAREKLRTIELASRLDLARVAAADGHGGLSAASLTALGQDAARLGLRFESVQFELLAADAELRAKRYAAARVQLEAALVHADRLNARSLLAEAHYLLSIADAAEGNQADRRRHAESARRWLDAIKKDAGSDDVLQRSDLKTIYDKTAL